MTCPVVGIGASAGGLAAISSLLSELPTKTGLAYLVVQHLSPTHGSILSEILAHRTRMLVAEAAHGTSVEHDHVYVIPPNTAMRIVDGRIVLRPRDNRANPAMPVDELFYSLAEDCRSNAIGVVLSGTGSDGALGMQAIKAAGGITFAQKASSAQFDGMPRAAIELGCVDFTLAPAEIAQELTRIRHHPYLAGPNPPAVDTGADSEPTLRRIFRQLRASCQIDFTHYKRPTVRRRIERRLAVHQLLDLEKYAALLEATPAEAHALCDDLLIRVTGFFRTPEVFEALTRIVFPRLVEHRPATSPLRIWVPGCASGEEVYSIAICLMEYLGERASSMPIRIFGTDLSEAAIQKARGGVYLESIARDVSPTRLERFFTKLDGHYEIAKPLRELCIFSRHNVANDPPFSRLDLVSCQNLLIYLDSNLQQKVIPFFHYSLNPGGVLILGPSESIGPHTELFSTLEPGVSNLYSKKSQPVRQYEVLPDRALPSSPRRSAHPPASGHDGDADQVRREADRLMLELYSPAGALCDEVLNVLQFRGDVSAFLVHAPGPPSVNLLKLIHPELLIELGRLHRLARDKSAPVRQEKVRFQAPDGLREVNLAVSPIQPEGCEQPCFLVLFESGPAMPKRVGSPSSRWSSLRASLRRSDPLPAEHAVQMEQLAQELATTRAHIKALLEEHESAEEELKAAQEELLSSNEEFQSTNEELATAKEELQSANEELITTNEELRHRNRELGVTNVARTEARDYADAIVETINEPLLVLDGELRIIRANRSFYAFFDAAPETTEQCRVFELEDNRWDIPELRHLLEKILPESSSFRDCEVTSEFPRIGKKTVRLNARRLDWTGHALILLAIEDITERQAGIKALTDANRRKDEFLAMLAHELRNPLAAIRNALEIWRSGAADQVMQGRAQAMLDRQLKKETRLVDDLLDVSRISRGSVSLQKETVDLVQIASEAIEEVRPLINSRMHELACEFPEGAVYVDGDATRLEQIVANLLSNSAKFTDPHGVIQLSIRRSADQAELRVIDNGIGIAPELLPAIFDLFVQAERSLDRSEGGLGLGLTLARRLIELHGGTIEARSGGRGKGSEFTVRIPLVSQVAPTNQHSAVESTRGPTVSRRILVVDDSADAAESSAMLLRLNGHEIQTAMDGYSAIDAVRSFKPEIVLLDIGLPGLNGYDVATRLRQLPECADTLVVALSGYGQPEDLKRSKEAGFDQHFVKPVDREQLVSLINAYNGVRAQ